METKRLIPVIILIVIFSFLNILPLFVSQKIARENELVSLNVMHWPGDYFYYLSQFKIGERNLFFSEDLYTTEFKDKTIVGWVNVGMGRLFHTIGVSSFDAYPISIVLLGILFIGSSYKLLGVLFEKESHSHFLSFISFTLFLFSNAVPKFDFTLKPVGIWFYDYWFNIGLPFTRLGGVPHQLLERTLIIISLLLFIKPFHHKVKNITAAGLVGFTLASVEPVHFLLVGLAIGLSMIIKFLRVKKLDLTFVLPFILVGGPVVIYLKKLFMSAPFTQLSSWEIGQSAHITIFELFLFHGPMVFLGILGMGSLILKLLKKGEVSSKNISIPIFTAISLVLFFSPIPYLLGIVNVRFLSAPIILFYCYFSVTFCEETLTKLGRSGKSRGLILSLLTLLIIFISLPSLFAQEKKRLEFDPKNLVYFVSDKAIDVYKQAENRSTDKDIFLVYWPFNSSFPALTGRRVYEGHPLLTINDSEKATKLFQFFDGKLDEGSAKQFLQSNGITKVIGYGGNLYLRESPFLNVEYDNSYLTIYKVKVN